MTIAIFGHRAPYYEIHIFIFIDILHNMPNASGYGV